MIAKIYRSFRAMPLWVQVWVAYILVPVNMMALFFVYEPFGSWIALLAIGAMAFNLPVMIYDKGFSKLMAIPHLVPWTILVLWLLLARPEASGGYAIYLWILLGVNAVSLVFDYPDAIKYIRGNRAVSR